MLAVLERQHKGTPAADCIVARMGELRAKADAEKAQAEAERAKAAAEAERQPCYDFQCQEWGAIFLHTATAQPREQTHA